MAKYLIIGCWVLVGFILMITIYTPDRRAANKFEGLIHCESTRKFIIDVVNDLNGKTIDSVAEDGFMNVFFGNHRFNVTFPGKTKIFDVEKLVVSAEFLGTPLLGEYETILDCRPN